MVRRGDLAHHPAADVLRLAATERLTGGIEFDGQPPVCVYLDHGQVYLAAQNGVEVALIVDDDLDDAAYELARQADEERVRAESASLVASLLARDQGWYFFHDLTDHPARGFWGWDVEELLAEVSRPAAPEEHDGARPSGPPPSPRPGDAGADAAMPAQGTALGRWSSVPSVAPTGPRGKPRPEDWAVLVAMAAPASPVELQRRLGWPSDRLAAVLDGMEERGLLVAGSEEGPHRPMPSA